MTLEVRKRRPRKKIWLNVIKFVISASLIIYLLQRVGLDSILQQLAAANWTFAVIGIGMFSLSNALGSLQWYILLRSQHIDISYRSVLSFYHVGLFFNNFLLGYVGGDAFRIWDISKKANDTTAAFSTVLFDRFVGFFALTSLAMIISLIWLQMLTSIKTVYFIAVVLGAWLFGLYLLFNERAARIMVNVFRPFLPRIVLEKSRNVYMAINRFRHKKRLMVRVFFIATIVQAMRVMVHYWAALAVGVNEKLLYFFIFIPIIAMAASLPISLGGIGVREQSGVSLFTGVGVAASKVVSFEFLAYLIAIIATIPGGIIFAIRREKEHIHYRRETNPL